jgi:hypothetical protein
MSDSLSLTCFKCRTTFDLPTGLTDAQRAALAAQRRHGAFGDATRWLTEQGLSERSAKAFYLHITRDPHRCNKCKTELDSAPVATCRKCRSVNFDW